MFSTNFNTETKRGQYVKGNNSIGRDSNDLTMEKINDMK